MSGRIEGGLVVSQAAPTQVEAKRLTFACMPGTQM